MVENTVDDVLEICRDKARLAGSGDGELSYYELAIAEAIRDDDLAKEAAFEEFETAQIEFGNRTTACRDRSQAVVRILFTGFNKKSFQTIEAVFPRVEKLTEKFWKARWAAAERQILEEAARAARGAGIAAAAVNRTDLKLAADRAAAGERDLAAARAALTELAAEVAEFDADEAETLSELAAAGYGTGDYRKRWWGKSYWDDRKKARAIAARLEDKTVGELLAWWNAAQLEKERAGASVAELGQAAEQWQQMAPFGRRLAGIGASLVEEVENALREQLLILDELSEEFRDAAGGGAADPLLRSELTRLIHQNNWAREGGAETEKRAAKLRVSQDRVFALHEALNAVRREESLRHGARRAALV